MHVMRRVSVIVAMALVGVFVAPLSASAHGYISSPASRQAQCAYDATLKEKCGDIKYEPQSVEARKGSTQCNGGNSRFPELNDDGFGWKPTSVSGGSVAFTWTFTARHATSDWTYYVNGAKVTTVSGGNKQPPATVTHTVNLGGAKGKIKVLSVWNISDTVNAFYSCVDLNVS
ncbi:chitin-binding protein [Pseudonocardiaceae bacterium YIM PH 21723]|nr:chitin-binding protein [Pseudonocardiaceae bacterium YIM PH 21723]